MNTRTSLVMSFTIFVAIGLLSASLGPALPDLADRAGRDLATLGSLVTMVWSGTLVAQLVAGALNDRWGQRPVLLGACTLATLGTLGILTVHNLWLLLGAGLVFGLGFGGLDIGTNLFIAQRFAQRSVPMLNLLHTFYGVGSIIGPAIAGLTLRLWDTALPALGVGVLIVLAPLPLILRLDSAPPPAARASNRRAAPSFSYRTPLLWTLGVLLMLFVGLEAGMGAWTTAYVDRTTTHGKEIGALITSGYWLALTVGRLVAAGYSAQFHPQTVLVTCMGGLLMGAALLAAGTGSVVVTALAVLVLGFWSGPPFPTMVAITTATFPQGPGKATSVVVAMASMGAVTLPWVQGALLDRISGLAMTLLIVAEAAAMLLIFMGVHGQRRQRPVAAGD
mgnify:CR=1 FL=1